MDRTIRSQLTEEARDRSDESIDTKLIRMLVINLRDKGSLGMHGFIKARSCF